VLTGRVGPLVRTFARCYPAPIAMKWNNIRSGLTRHVIYPNLSDIYPWNWISATPALRQSNGTALAVSDEEMLHYAGVMGKHTGIFPAPEGAACLAAQVHLINRGWIKPDDQVVLFNTGSGLKYAHLWAGREIGSL